MTFKSYKYTFITSMVFLVTTLISCNKESGSKPTGESTEKENTSVAYVTPEMRSFSSNVRITGTAMPNKKVKIYPKENGYIVKMKHDIGDRVEKGEIIALLENPMLSRDKQRLTAMLKSKKSVFERLKSVREKSPSLTPIQEVENAEADYLSTKAQLNSVEDRIGFLKVKAPFSGVITQRFVFEGALLQNGLTEDSAQAIVELQQVNPVRVTIPLPETDAVYIADSTKAKVVFPERSSREYEAEISRTSKSLNQSSKTMQVEIDVDNEDASIMTGMYAKVELQLQSSGKVLSLPIMAKTMYNDEPHLMIVEEGVVKRKTVSIGLKDQNYFQILNDDFDNNTKVIVQGKGLVQVGDEVNAVLKN